MSEMEQVAQDNIPVSLRQRKKLRTRNDLFAIAQTLFSKKAFEDVTVGEIADLANVSANTFFNYFQNKSQFLAEYMLDWAMTIGFWTIADAPITDCRSALIPPDAHQSLNWIVEHRRMLKMALQHTDFFDFIYRLDEKSTAFDEQLYASIRAPRLERVTRAKSKGVIRSDLEPVDVCRLYDGGRVNVVKRWLYMQDEDATDDVLHAMYEDMVRVLIRGIEA